ncbi:hypothetical protein AGR6A_Lc90363 [Agrobacterium sp. NCPPB 925]|nr:hypothetical protein AGR6A_Lc90363 [Agrobacterium sp. NCPPB 925]
MGRANNNARDATRATDQNLSDTVIIPIFSIGHCRHGAP